MELVCVCVYMHEYVIQCMSVCLHKLNYVYECAQYVCVQYVYLAYRESVPNS